MITLAKSTIADHWSYWDEKFVPAPPFNVEAFQEKLDIIAGKSRDKSILRLEWGGNATVTRYTDWDGFGNPTHLEIRPRYAIPRRHKILDYEMYIPVRRWIITERMEYEQSRPDDDSDVTFTNENGIVCLGGKKEKETYLPYIYVGDHSNCPPDCCKTKLCLGDYKVPNEAELNYLRSVTRKLATEFYGNPYSQLSDEQMAKIRREYKETAEKRKEAALNEFDDESRDIFNVIKHRLTSDDPTVHAKGRFHFMEDNKPV